MKTINCLHLIPKTEGGIRQHFFTIIDGLNNLPLHHLVAGPNDIFLIKEADKRGLEYIKLDMTEEPKIINLFAAVNQVKKIIINREVKIVHSHGHKMSLVGRFGSFFSGKEPKSIVTIHNFSHPNFLGKVLKIINQVLDGYSAKIISVSNALLREEILPRNHKKATVIYNGIDLNKFLPDTDFSSEVNVIGVVARLAPQKGLNVLINAFQTIGSEFPEIMLHIIGDGPEKALLIKQAEELGVKDKIKFLGQVNDIVKALKKVDIFVMPSLSEGLSIATIEAMALQKPVIVSNSGGLVEVVENNSGLLVKSGSVPQLTTAIRKMILSKELRQRLAANGRKRIEKHFNIEQMQRKTSNIYEELLTQNNIGKCGENYR